MNWWDKVFAYCERGLDPGFWGEPLNALSNGAFIIAALGAWLAYRRLPAGQGRPVHVILIASVAAIGVGSFLFHTVAERWSALADVVPIGLFMLIYTVAALALFLQLTVVSTVFLAGLFVAAMMSAGVIAAKLGCDPGPGRCLNGTVGYLPALVALASVSAAALVRSHPARTALSSATLVLALSLSLRTVDRTWCEATRPTGPLTRIMGEAPTGTHFVWHLLNALVLSLLIQAMIRHGRAQR